MGAYFGDRTWQRRLIFEIVLISFMFNRVKGIRTGTRN